MWTIRGCSCGPICAWQVTMSDAKDDCELTTEELSFESSASLLYRMYNTVAMGESSRDSMAQGGSQDVSRVLNPGSCHGNASCDHRCEKAHRGSCEVSRRSILTASASPPASPPTSPPVATGQEGLRVSNAVAAFKRPPSSFLQPSPTLGTDQDTDVGGEIDLMFGGVQAGGSAQSEAPSSGVAEAQIWRPSNARTEFKASSSESATCAARRTKSKSPSHRSTRRAHTIATKTATHEVERAGDEAAAQKLHYNHRNMGRHAGSAEVAQPAVIIGSRADVPQALVDGAPDARESQRGEAHCQVVEQVERKALAPAMATTCGDALFAVACGPVGSSEELPATHARNTLVPPSPASTARPLKWERNELGLFPNRKLIDEDMARLIFFENLYFRLDVDKCNRLGGTHRHSGTSHHTSLGCACTDGEWRVAYKHPCGRTCKGEMSEVGDMLLASPNLCGRSGELSLDEATRALSFLAPNMTFRDRLPHSALWQTVGYTQAYTNTRSRARSLRPDQTSRHRHSPSECACAIWPCMSVSLATKGVTRTRNSLLTPHNTNLFCTQSCTPHPLYTFSFVYRS